MKRIKNLVDGGREKEGGDRKARSCSLKIIILCCCCCGRSLIEYYYDENGSSVTDDLFVRFEATGQEEEISEWVL